MSTTPDLQGMNDEMKYLIQTIPSDGKQIDVKLLCIQKEKSQG